MNPKRYISDWKLHGLIGDYDKIWERYFNTKYCDLCNVELTKGNTRFGKCMDHDHDSGKFRNIVCRTCNNRLPKQKSKIRNDNTTGHKGITFVKKKGLWCYRDRKKGQTFKKMCKCKITLLTYKFCHLLLMNRK